MGRGASSVALLPTEDRLRTSLPVLGLVSSANMPPCEVPDF